MLVVAGISHLTVAREEFTAQVPEFVPLSDDTVVVASGVVEITLGSALLLLAGRRVPISRAAALFFQTAALRSVRANPLPPMTGHGWPGYRPITPSRRLIGRENRSTRRGYMTR
ncbi:hypothetical protein [Brachybacterium fresconis]|uniref:DoxX family protein n=1 Tax=Brachybacterium fresconis TaxID=173363 RepID=A0ABS4YFK2_9MICO|nr:hypothetical protein [Brachybacterium fresconis]MBP2407581.1 hypothetical protein [Brachybacterium fresconis]